MLKLKRRLHVLTTKEVIDLDILAWIIIISCFIVAFVGLVYPIIPSVVFIIAGFLSYGLFYDFSQMGWLFWSIQVLFVVMLFAADTIANLIGVKKFGGSKAGMVGSTIGLLVGPFVIPVAGILLGPFIGAVLAELLVTRVTFEQSLKAGIGSLIGFLTSAAAKAVIQSVMIGIFIWTIL